MKPNQKDVTAMGQLLDLLADSAQGIVSSIEMTKSGRYLEATKAVASNQDIPVAAGVFDADGNLCTWATNQRELTGDPTAHAEVVALRRAAQLTESGWRLTDCTLVVTLEPCAMCAGAALNARVARVVFGANEPKTGAAGSLIDILRDPRNVHRPEVVGGVLADQCEQVLKAWFANLRDTKDVFTDD